MRKLLLLLLLVSSLFLSYDFLNNNQAKAQTEDQYILQLQGFAWNQTTLNVLIVTPTNESWWNPVYSNCVLRAIGQWNDAITVFASNYSDYAYLSSLSIQSAISNETQPGFDIYINWTQSPLIETEDQVGLSKIVVDKGGAIINSTINLAASTNHGVAISEGDAQNIALHELGHSLGLGHCNYTADLMYPVYTLQGSAQDISTLDAYGVATVFVWKLESSFYPIRAWLKEKSVSLPATVPYGYLPVSSENVRPATLADNPVVQFLILIGQILIHPEVLVSVIVVIVIFVIIAFIPTKKRPKVAA
ncbi:MAG: matrixin family metalloprotease [Candidatus Bathyarchaeota archaeon]|nr:matrixin family metalloprotease [Candidatus Bathyarchaeota archaeon]